MMRVARCFSTVMALALVAGCNGGQTGDLSGESNKKGRTTGNENGCEDQLSEIELDDASALGFDARRVLAFAERPFQSGLVWQALDNVEYSPAASESTLTLTLSSKNKAWFVHSVPAPSTDSAGGGALLAPLCPPDRLRISVHVELHSADGALAESFDESLEARSPAVATLSRPLVAEQIGGSFAITKVTPPSGSGTASVQDLGFSTTLTPGGMAGSLTARLSQSNGQVASVSPLTFARFPGDPRCASSGGLSQAVPIDASSAALGQTGAEAVSAVNAWGAIPFTWDDGARSALTLELSDLADGCVEVADNTGLQDPTLPAATAVYPVVLQAASADGRWQGQYPAKLVTWPNIGAGFSERIEVNGTFPGDTSAGIGFDPVSIPTGTQRLNLRLEALFEGASASGQVTLDSLKDPPCVTNPEPPSGNAAAPCSGTSVARVLGATWPG